MSDKTHNIFSYKIDEIFYDTFCPNYPNIPKMLIIGDEKSIAGVYFITQKNLPKLAKNLNPTMQNKHIFKSAKTWLNQYFSNQIPNIALNLNIGAFSPSIFRQLVWLEALKIPYGKKISYKQMSKNLLDSQFHPRAIAGALSRNQIMLVIPCHRVLSSSGNLSGYSAGVALKSTLLSLESKICAFPHHFEH